MSNQNDEFSDFQVPFQSLSFLQCNSNARLVLNTIRVLGKNDPDIAKCHGAYFAKSDRDGVPFFSILVGTMPRSERFRCEAFVREKLHRVCLLAAYTNHMLSGHSIDRDIERYPGAVLGTNFGHAISAFPGLVDEMGACAWAVLDGDLTVEEAIALTSGNKYFDMLKGLFYLKPNDI